jgi:GxxExxY protein
MIAQTKRNDLIYADLCYQLMGVLFEIWKNIGFGHKEKIYEKAIAKSLENAKIEFKEQVPVKINFKGKFIGIYYFDFLINDKIVLEIKVRNYFSKKDIDQLYSYLKARALKLGIIAHFTRTGVKFKRIVNLK